MVIDSLVKSEKKEKHFKTLEDIDSKPTNTVIEKLPDACIRHLQPAQETEEERQYRYQQIDYERNGSYTKNKKLATSINSLAEQNFTNRILVAACNFTEMAENHPRSIFIQTFGELIEEELKENPTRPSQRLASFATTYFWEEANKYHMIQAIPAGTTRNELVEFFNLPLNSEPDKKIVDCLHPQTIWKILEATADDNNKKIKFNTKKDKHF